jgi:hypothetical protein
MTLTAKNIPTDLRGCDFNVVLMDLDVAIGETICQNADNSYTIFINSRLSSEMQRRCFEHALEHVRNNDWEKENADEIEYERHKGEK